MKRFALLMVVAVVVMAMVGCIGIGGTGLKPVPTARLLSARDTFNATVHSLAALREAGAFTKAEAENVTMIIALGEQTLNRWEAAIELGQSNEGFMRDMNFIVRELVARRIAAARRKRGTGFKPVVPERKAKDGRT